MRAVNIGCLTLLTVLTAAIFASIVSGAMATPAASIYLCVAETAGGSVKSGGTSGTCESGAIPVALPQEAAAQQKLLAILPYEQYVEKGIDGKPTVQFSGANLQVVSGLGTTAELNGAGNLIIGYDEDPGVQTGSNNLLLGGGQKYTSYGSLIAGTNNTDSAPFGVVLGMKNVASGKYATVTGGTYNTASATAATVSGGGGGKANGEEASIGGGVDNEASALDSSVGGGYDNTAAGSYSSVSGGILNLAMSYGTSITGGRENTAEHSDASVTGGAKNTASGISSAILGGKEITVSTEYGVSP